MCRVVSYLWDRGYESAMVTVVGGHGRDGSVYVSVVGCGWEA